MSSWRSLAANLFSTNVQDSDLGSKSKTKTPSIQHPISEMWSTAIFLLLFISSSLPDKIWQAVFKVHPLHVSARRAFFARQALLFFSSCRKERQNSHNPQPPLCVSNCRSALHRLLHCQRRLGHSRWTFRLCWGNRFGRWCHSQEASHSLTNYEVLAMAYKIDILYLGFQARPPVLAVFWILCPTKSWSVLSFLLSPMLARYLHRSLALLSPGECV